MALPDRISSTPPRGARRLTAAEATATRGIFGTAIDLDAVRIHRRGYLWFGLQRPDTAMAPDGHVYFPEPCFREDFADPAQPWLGRWLVHEMTHVWQRQMGYPVKWRGAIRLGLSYRYRLAPGRTFRDYDMEAQGELLADWHALRTGRPDCIRDPRHRADPHFRGRLQAALRDFLLDPGDRDNLPPLVGRWRLRR
ncbi:hypothetical protein [Coralloluteibacterium thermophilus]|uniref:Rhs element Vgr protein n=1 Tax=Coralloluteibacterium thermophilum TaxID=2707049 RepID=A0ABV9NMM3_9GAMM